MYRLLWLVLAGPRGTNFHPFLKKIIFKSKWSEIKIKWFSPASILLYSGKNPAWHFWLPPRKILCNLAQKIAFSQTAATTKLCKNKVQIEHFDQLQAQALIYFQHFKKYSLNCQIHAYSEKTLLFEVPIQVIVDSNAKGQLSTFWCHRIDQKPNEFF